MEQFHYFILSNSMRCVAIRRPDATVEHLGVCVNAGSRDETPALEGLAHFVEHTIFKGTSRRRSWHILNRMEAVGGELNAYTTKEETVLYTTFPAGEFDRAADLVADLIADSRFPAIEIDRERQVVADEINTYLDIPSEGIFDDFDALAFSGSTLAHPILGNLDTLATFSTDVCSSWLNSRYTPGRMVLFYSGACPLSKFEAKVEKLFGCIRRPDTPLSRVVPVSVAPFDGERDIQSHQAHTLLGARIGGLQSSDRYALSLLTNILGGPGMNSLLNVELRERRGLVYTIDASTSLLTDCGLLSIYFGCNSEDTPRCVRLVRKVVDSLASSPLSERRLEAAKRQYIGQMTVSSVNTEQTALAVARATMHCGRALTMAEISENIRAVTRADLQRVAGSLEFNRLTLK